MPDVWLPGVHIDRGVNAGYNSGTNSLQRAVAHYTVGSDSRGTGRSGYFHWLVHRDASREGGCTQYAEIDAKTWHGYKEGQYDANSAGPGIEWERLVTGGINAEGLSDAQPLTQNQLDWGARIISFCAEWGIPVQLYDGPRYSYGGWHGWINHQALDSDRSDGLLRSEWDAMAGAGPGPGPAPMIQGDDDTMLIVNKDTNAVAILCGDHLPQKIASVNDYHNGPSVFLPNGAWQQYFDNAIKIHKAVVGQDQE